MQVTLSPSATVRGSTASANTTIQVVRPAPVVELTFEDVYFDFDRSTLRPDAMRLLDDAVAKQQANPTKNIGHRRPHLQHRHGGIQPGAWRTPQRAACSTTPLARRRFQPA